jgi:hypothetical protein
MTEMTEMEMEVCDMDDMNLLVVDKTDGADTGARIIVLVL